MAKAAYIGVGGVARKVKKIYIGVGGVARKVKKAYIGVAGMARLFFSADRVVSSYGEVSGSNLWPQSMGASTTHHGIVMGGNYTTAAANAWDSNLVYSGTAQSYMSVYGRGLSFNGYAMFSGGWISSGQASQPYVKYYNDSLVLSDAPTMGVGVNRHATINFKNNYALFGGGFDRGTCTSQVNAYTSSLVRSYPTSLTRAVFSNAGATTASYALFAGGSRNPYTVGDVNPYNSSLTQMTTIYLGSAKYDLGGASVNGYAIFAGGLNDDSLAQKTVDIFNDSLVRSAGADLPAATRAQGCASTEDFAFFGGGNTNDLYVYNSALVRTQYSLPNSTAEVPAIVIDNKYVLFEQALTKNKMNVWQVL